MKRELGYGAAIHDSDRNRRFAQVYTEWLQELGNNPELVAGLRDKYRRFPPRGDGPKIEPIEDFNIRDFTLQMDSGMPEFDGAVIVSYRGRPAFHIVLEQTGRNEIDKEKTQAALIDTIQAARSDIDPDYERTGYLPEMPIEWLNQVEVSFAALENDPRLAELKEAVHPGFKLSDIRIRQYGVQATSYAPKVVHDFSVGMYYKGRLFFTIGRYNTDSSRWNGRPDDVAMSLFDHFVTSEIIGRLRAIGVGETK